MKLVFLLLVLVSLNYITSMSIDTNSNIFDYEDVENKIKCSITENEVNCKNPFINKIQLLDNLLKRKTNSNAATTLASFQNVEQKEARIIPYYHSTQPISCSCGINFHLTDLGNSYYPRYVHTGTCQSNGCGGLYRCTGKHYKVRVLKRRSGSEQGSTESQSIDTSLPEILQDFWISEVVTVIVACECSL